MPKMYANAKDVLPAELFEQLKAHHTGLIYVAGTERQGSARTRLALGMAAQGTPKAKVAASLGITRRRLIRSLPGSDWPYMVNHPTRWQFCHQRRTSREAMRMKLMAARETMPKTGGNFVTRFLANSVSQW